MKGFWFWLLDRVLLVVMTLLVLFEDTFSNFEKCTLILIIGVIMVLNNIKDVIDKGLKISN